MLDFRILGPLEVRDEQAPIALGGPRQRALLVALLLRAGRVVPTEQLVDELYGEEPPKTATTSLQNAIVALRKLLGSETLLTRSPGYVLQIAREQVDAHRFEQLLADARRATRTERRALLGRALELWRGTALAEFAFEDWAHSETRRLGELRLVALEERIETDIELGHAADVVAELESLVREHPLRERLWSSDARTPRARGGRPRRSMHTRRRARALDELGVEPGESLRRLQGEILRGEATRPPLGERSRRTRRGRGGRQGAPLRARRPGRSDSTVAPISPGSSRRRSATRPTGRWTSHASRSTWRR